MAIVPEPATVLLPALVAGLALAVRGGARRRGGPRPGVRVLVAALAGLAVLGACVATGFDSGERRMPVWIGLAVGALLGAMWEWAFPPNEQDPADLGPMGAGLAALAALGLALPAGVPFANAALALLAAWAVPQVVRVAAPAATDVDAPGAPGFALAAVGLTAGTMAWAMRLPAAAGHDLGAVWPLPLAVATLAAIGLALAGLAGPRRSGPLGAAIAAIFCALAGVLMAGPVYQQPGTLLAALAAGAVAGLCGGAALAGTERPGPLAALAVLAIAGGLLVIENRLLGVLAIGLGGLGLLAGGGGTRGPRPLVALAVAIFAARVWLQLFLDRTALTGYGVDLTHPYTFAALILGGLLPGAAVALGRPCRPLPSLAVGWALLLALLPAWLGFLIHIEALGGLLAGLLLAAFLVGARGVEAEGGDRGLLAAVVPALGLQVIAVSLLAAPWLVDEMNAPREARIHAFLAMLGVMLLAALRWWWDQRQAARSA